MDLMVGGRFDPMRSDHAFLLKPSLRSPDEHRNPKLDAEGRGNLGVAMQAGAHAGNQDCATCSSFARIVAMQISLQVVELSR